MARLKLKISGCDQFGKAVEPCRTHSLIGRRRADHALFFDLASILYRLLLSMHPLPDNARFGAEYESDDCICDRSLTSTLWLCPIRKPRRRVKRTMKTMLERSPKRMRILECLYGDDGIAGLLQHYVTDAYSTERCVSLP